MIVQELPIEMLIPYARNARTHSDEQVAQIAGSIREFGFCNPVLIDQGGGIIAGHGRVLAARKLGMQEVPCIRLGHLTDVQRRAYILADNKLALNAGWDYEILKLEIESLLSSEFSMHNVGFSEAELDELLNGWNPDLEKIEQVQPKMSDLEGTVKVTCAQEVLHEVKEIIVDAINAAGMTGVDVK